MIITKKNREEIKEILTEIAENSIKEIKDLMAIGLNEMLNEMLEIVNERSDKMVNEILNTISKDLRESVKDCSVKFSSIIDMLNESSKQRNNISGRILHSINDYATIVRNQKNVTPDDFKNFCGAIAAYMNNLAQVVVAKKIEITEDENKTVVAIKSVEEEKSKTEKQSEENPVEDLMKPSEESSEKPSEESEKTQKEEPEKKTKNDEKPAVKSRKRKSNKK